MRDYRAKKKQERDKKRFEERITNLMNKLDCTRSEAIEIIKADSKV
jgi:hypothetical protein